MKAEIGARLKRLRMDRGLTQKELAARTDGGIDYTYIGKIERGEQLPSLKILLKISDALAVPVSSFFQDDRSVSLADARLQRLAGKQGNELFAALQLLHVDDLPLLTEIIHVLVRHRESRMREGIALLAAEKKTPYNGDVNP